MTSFIPPDVKTFVSWDYVVFAALFLISSSIGIFFAVKERKKTSSTNFLVGGRQMTCGPVALSLTASFMSAVTVLGTPAEVYRHGSSFVLFFIAYAFVVLFTAELFLPVFYKSGITSTYEYLELRFNRLVRVAATLIYIVQTIVYTGVVVYAPALALNQVTGFNLWGSVFATGIVCTFYCTLGGLKAVVWTDAFQLVVMVIGFLTVLIQGTLQNGGLGNVWEDAKNGSRLDIFDFDADPLKRHTFWTIAVGGTFTWLGIYGVNQSTIQRCISCKTEKHAKLALYLNLVGLWIILICAVLCGLVMYSHFRSCDPWTAGFISAPDQLMPYFVMILFSSVPGLPGLFVACAFSGTLSTVAASINALATVTFEDFVKSCFPKLSERMNTWVSKGLCIVFGVLCTTMAVAASLMGGVVQASLSIHGMCGGPMLGLFTLGVLFPCTNWKGALGGLFTGISLAFWVGIGAFVYPAPPSKTLPLHLSTAGCIVNNTDAVATVLPTVPPIRPYLADTWYSLSYLYYSAVGCLGCIMAGLLISFVTGPSKGEDITPTLIRPVCNLFCFWSPKCKTLCWCGVDHDNCKGLHEELKIDWQKDHTKKAEASDVQKNGLDGLSISIQSHLPGYNPSEKSYTNPGMETESHF
ncbi:Sodium-coupled monocarboxylate transporter 2 [Varanus komodoensis]|uniref:sodium-coupled monocarboxylate transporter 2 n=1 Tax=Varanus komodoensis TaxID=61221 RepID=UPI001CF7CECB|nr:sodium-coupled monocarboxylate transporter 2 [Varanus komodoensis]KAF7245632.1 Sodium-coupled monocarboxylate transporter 2 [Varanus komodoensis]